VRAGDTSAGLGDVFIDELLSRAGVLQGLFPIALTEGTIGEVGACVAVRGSVDDECFSALRH
jgi:hypothetical protein